MRIDGILETALYVADPARSADFYRRVFGFLPLLQSERLVALEIAGKGVLLLFRRGDTDRPFETPGGTIPAHGGSGRCHFAFSIAAEEVEAWRGRLESEAILEGAVDWPGGAVSLYFRDLDGNLGELMTPGFWAWSRGIAEPPPAPV
ncbi:VOC family protein [Paludisphaera soli]|uniref:VOC family protein n=1 Tax=Paludisphaera soli TaxID=2712865 RepID=UPI0013E9A984|nr:VOC family protein [Paludisphaera soli]